MTYEASEISVSSGQPVELYNIAMGSTRWRLSSGGVDKVHLGHTYESVPCKCGELEQTDEIPKDGIELELPRGHALGVLAIAGTLEEEVTITIYRCHGTDYVIYFKGFLTNVRFNENSIPICFFEPRSSDLPFVGGRRRCMRLCGHKLYGYRCGLNKENYKVTGTIDTIDGVTITSSEFGDVGEAVPEVYGDLTKLAGCTYVANTNSSYAYRAFDGNVSTDWNTPSGYSLTNNWIYCKWTAARTIRKIRIRPGHIYKYVWSTTGAYLLYPGEGCMKHFRVAGSNNGSDWTTIPITSWLGNCSEYNGEGGSDTEVDELINEIEWISVFFDNLNTYTYYRIWVYDYWEPSSYSWSGWPLFINEIEMIEADNAMSVYSFGAGGVIQVGSAVRMITSHVGDTITISRKFGSDVTAGSGGSIFTAWPGCAHTPSCCHVKFGNMPNYGGQEHLPLKNPYKGDLIH